jgi:hypothetical protein
MKLNFTMSSNNNLYSGENFNTISAGIIFDIACGLLLLCSEPPHQRLVGIELNPGPKNPPSFLKAALKAGKAAASAVATVTKMVSKKKGTPGKKKKSRATSGLVMASNSNRYVTAPSIVGFNGFGGSSESVVSMPFSGLSISLLATTSTPSGSVTFLDGTNTNINGLDLNPASYSSYPALCGLSLANLAKSFVLFRFRRLQVEFVPVYPTSYGGVMAFGFTANTADIAPASIQAVLSSSTNMISSIWSPCSMNIPVHESIQNWYIVNPSGATTYVSSRQSAPGSIQCYYSLPGGSVTANALMGFLRIEGVIEFSQLARADLLDPAPSVSRQIPQPSSQALISVSESKSFDEMVDVPPNSPEYTVLANGIDLSTPLLQLPTRPNPNLRYPTSGTTFAP